MNILVYCFIGYFINFMNITQQKKCYRKSSIAIFDLDGTLIEGHLWNGLYKYNKKNKNNLFLTFWYLIYHIFLAIPWKIKLLSTKIYYQSWAKNLSWLLKGVGIDQIEEIFDWVCKRELLPTIKQKTLERLRWHQKRGDITILASNSFQKIVDKIKDYLSMDFSIGTQLEVMGGRLTGRIIPPLPFGEKKASRIQKLIKEENIFIDFKSGFAYSDSYFDLPMLSLVGNPVVVDPDKNLLQIAQYKGWEILIH